MSQLFVSKNNSTITPLGAGGTFVGVPDVLTSFAEIDLNIFSAPDYASGTLYFEFSPNGTDWDVSVPLVISGSGTPPILLRSILTYFRIRYINGPTPLTELRLTTVFHRNSATRLTRFLNQDIDNNEPVEIVRVAKSVIPDGFSRSAFGEQRVAPLFTLTDLVNKYEIDSREYGTQTATGGAVTHLPNESAIRLSVTASSGSSAILRTHNFYRYQAGKGLLIKQSMYQNDTGQANQKRRWGFFDTNDGIFWELNGTSFGVVRRTSTSGSIVESSVLQTAWNVDKLDGAGTSKVTLDVTKGNIYEIQLAWLGVGKIRFFINNILVHEMNNQNSLAVPYIKTAQLPLQYEVVNTGASAISSMTHICASVIVEGGEDPPSFSFSAANLVDKTVGSTEIPLLSIRLKSTYNSIVNRMLVLPLSLSVSTSSGRASYGIYFTPSLTAASWTSAGSTSGVEFDTSATSFTGGELIYKGFMPDTIDNQFVDLRPYFDNNSRKMRLDAFGATSDIITIVAKIETGGLTAMRANLVWEEIR